MNRIRTFSEKDEKEICKKYKEEGKTITEITKIYHCRGEAIKNVLLKYQIPIRAKGTYKNTLVESDCFEKIDTEEKAYFLGLLFTDGSVCIDKKGKRSPQILLELK